MFDIAKRINQLCQECTIGSIYELSKVTGVTQSTLQSVMSGNSPRTDTIERICQGLGITMADFFSLENKPSKEATFNMSLKSFLIDYPEMLSFLKSNYLPLLRTKAYELYGDESDLIKVIDKFEYLPVQAQVDFILESVQDIQTEQNTIRLKLIEPNPLIEEIAEKTKNLPAKDQKELLHILIEQVSLSRDEF